jgi:peroxiredoxin Q/BCP
MLNIGDKAPEFELPDDEGRTIRLSDLLREGPVVLYFYPADFTPVCTRQACMFRDFSADLVARGIRVLGISPQPAGLHARFRQRHGLPFPLLTDPGKRTVRAYEARGLLGLITRRISYLIGTDGTIWDAVKADFRLGEHEAFVRRVLERVK